MLAHAAAGEEKQARRHFGTETRGFFFPPLLLTGNNSSPRYIIHKEMKSDIRFTLLCGYTSTELHENVQSRWKDTGKRKDLSQTKETQKEPTWRGGMKGTWGGREGDGKEGVGRTGGEGGSWVSAHLLFQLCWRANRPLLSCPCNPVRRSPSCLGGTQMPSCHPIRSPEWWRNEQSVCLSSDIRNPLPSKLNLVALCIRSLSIRVFFTRCICFQFFNRLRYQITSCDAKLVTGRDGVCDLRSSLHLPSNLNQSSNIKINIWSIY